MKIEECINYQLTQAQGKVNALFKKNLQELDITPAQYALLYYLWKEDGLSPTQLAERCGLDTSTITGLLTRLEKKELIGRRQSADDRRGVEVYLTEQGWALQAPICGVIDRTNEEILLKLPQDARSTLVRCLSQLCSALDD